MQEFFTSFHGHQSQTLAWCVLGAIRAKGMVLPQVAEARLAEREAKASRSERRLERFLSNPRIDVEQTWEELLTQVMPFFRQKPRRLLSDFTPYEEHAPVSYVGLLPHSRVLPLVWNVIPGQQTWDQGFWEGIGERFERLAPHVGNADGTIIGERAFGCFPMVPSYQWYDWHSLFRIAGHHTCQRRSSRGPFGESLAVSKLVREPGKRFPGAVRLWQNESIETEWSLFWEATEEEALIVISDRRPAKDALPKTGSAGEWKPPFKMAKAEGGMGKPATSGSGTE